jgi:hypothetical protein
MTDSEWDDYVAGRNPNSLGNEALLVFEKIGLGESAFAVTERSCSAK